MTELRFESLVMPSASMGQDNPLPDLQKNMDAHANIAIDKETISAEESQYMGWGRVNGILPYTIRDGYNREKAPRAWKAAVLTNDYLVATFLPELGGRLWSLVDKSTGKELLHRNPVFQPCNLALRNAWISGGVEWNVGIIGHTPYTVDPLYTETLSLKDGTPVLRMYQYERVRRLVYRVEALLPEDSRELLVRVRVDNTSDADTAVYWWSNMAVDEREDVRVLVPATRAYRYEYGNMLTKIPVPVCNGRDASHTTTINQAMDFFFDIESKQRRWIAALDSKGYGLCQTSTDVLQGRKLFVWGMNPGGRHWQSFLAQPGCAYLEIQAGLAHTQLEHLPMPGGASYSWVEAYGAVQTDPKVTHGSDWAAATGAVDAALEVLLPRKTMEAWEKTLAKQLDGRHGEMLQLGDGWGALEAQLYGKAFSTYGLRFPARAIRASEREWLDLLKKGALPCPDPLALPKGYQIGDGWLRALEASIASGKGDHWFANYHLGVMKAYRNDVQGARAAFERSIAQAVSPWALRCLAVLDAQNNQIDKAADLMLKAVALKPQRHLVLEAMQVLLKAERYADMVDVAASAPAAIRRLGRLKALHAEALLKLGKLSKAERILRSDFQMTDVKEGEVKLTDLWFMLCELKGVSPEDNPPPIHLDFRMH